MNKTIFNLLLASALFLSCVDGPKESRFIEETDQGVASAAGDKPSPTSQASHQLGLLGSGLQGSQANNNSQPRTQPIPSQSERLTYLACSKNDQITDLNALGRVLQRLNIASRLISQSCLHFSFSYFEIPQAEFDNLETALADPALTLDLDQVISVSASWQTNPGTCLADTLEGDPFSLVDMRYACHLEYAGHEQSFLLNRYNLSQSPTTVKIATLDTRFPHGVVAQSDFVTPAVPLPVWAPGTVGLNPHHLLVAATLFSSHDQIANAGVYAKPSSWVPYQVPASESGMFTLSDIVTALDQMLASPEINQVRVLNISLSGASSDAIRHRISRLLTEKNILIVAAAGNDSASRPTFPASFPGVVAVSASQARGLKAHYSNAGGDLLAPGKLKSAFKLNQRNFVFDPSNPTVTEGTSFASPRVAGVLAILLEQIENAMPNLSTVEKNALAKTAIFEGADKGISDRNLVSHGMVDAAGAYEKMNDMIESMQTSHDFSVGTQDWPALAGGQLSGAGARYLEDVMRKMAEPTSHRYLSQFRYANGNCYSGYRFEDRGGSASSRLVSQLRLTQIDSQTYRLNGVFTHTYRTRIGVGFPILLGFISLACILGDAGWANSHVDASWHASSVDVSVDFRVGYREPVVVGTHVQQTPLVRHVDLSNYFGYIWYPVLDAYIRQFSRTVSDQWEGEAVSNYSNMLLQIGKRLQGTEVTHEAFQKLNQSIIPQNTKQLQAVEISPPNRALVSQAPHQLLAEKKISSLPLPVGAGSEPVLPSSAVELTATNDMAGFSFTTRLLDYMQEFFKKDNPAFRGYPFDYINTRVRVSPHIESLAVLGITPLSLGRPRFSVEPNGKIMAHFPLRISMALTDENTPPSFQSSATIEGELQIPIVPQFKRFDYSADSDGILPANYHFYPVPWADIFEANFMIHEGQSQIGDFFNHMSRPETTAVIEQITRYKLGAVINHMDFGGAYRQAIQLGDQWGVPSDAMDKIGPIKKRHHAENKFWDLNVGFYVPSYAKPRIVASQALDRFELKLPTLTLQRPVSLPLSDHTPLFPNFKTTHLRAGGGIVELPFVRVELRAKVDRSKAYEPGALGMTYFLGRFYAGNSYFDTTDEVFIVQHPAQLPILSGSRKPVIWLPHMGQHFNNTDYLPKNPVVIGQAIGEHFQEQTTCIPSVAVDFGNPSRANQEPVVTRKWNEHLNIFREVSYPFVYLWREMRENQCGLLNGEGDGSERVPTVPGIF